MPTTNTHTCRCYNSTGDDDVDLNGTASIGIASKASSKKTKAKSGSMPRLVVNAFGDVEYPDKDVPTGTY